MKQKKIRAGRVLALVLATALSWHARPAGAVPSFARQTGMACEACHTVFPQLTHFGRMFKANGYTLDNLRQVRGMDARRKELLDLSQTPPISIMIQVSDTQLAKAVPDTSSGTPVGVSQNGTVAFPQQVSIFYAGKIAPHLGAFLQLTYGNDSGSIGIDNTDLRFANMIVLPKDQTLLYGLSLNNNPTVQDLWNSTPAFGFPYQVSNATVGAIAGTQIDGTLAQDVAGLTAYVLWNESLYAEFGAYRSAKQGRTNTLTGAAGPLDGATTNVIRGLAPYWRLAYEHNWSRHSLEIGAYGFDVSLLPGGSIPGSDEAPGVAVPLGGLTNEFKDVAADVQYQFLGDQHLFAFAATHIHESMRLNASFAAAAAGGSGSANPSDTLNTTRADFTYYYRRKIGGTISYFATTGSTDAGLYPSPAPSGDPGVVTSANNTPGTRGWVAEFNYLPWLNTKFTLQYTAYQKFNGGSSNYDGVGRSASDNNAWYLLAWLSY